MLFLKRGPVICYVLANVVTPVSYLAIYLRHVIKRQFQKFVLLPSLPFDLFCSYLLCTSAE